MQLRELRGRNSEKRSAVMDEQIARLRQQLGEMILSGSDSIALGRQARLEHQRIDCVGLPEISGEDLNAETLSSALLHQGALVVRSLFSETQLHALRAHCDIVDAPEDDGTPWACNPSELFDLVENYHDSGLVDAIAGHLEAEPLLFAERAKLRKHSSEKDRYAAVKWHQDVSFFGKDCQGVNCWAAVTPCGEDNPGLAFVPTRFNDHPGWNGEDVASLDYGLDVLEELVLELQKEHPIVYPVLEPGDAILFDEMTLHSTAVRPWKRLTQVVAISWFFPARAFPAWGTPLATG